MSRPTYLRDASIDDVARMIEGLVEELWVTKDRLFVLEEVLAAHGGVTAEEIDRHVPSDELHQRLTTERLRLIQRVLGAPEVD